ncbi:hypothetical protein BFP72_02985 [Reichenbachiella sp. 5M10]|uniref:DUF952 domain-containing protein n=1 Tax=Reichenbachiella sp. 5M10 TaxID=1889772 RepID=UPI000C14D942|nr:DUF952 domain-containing protein [Reichenbachiella sp. 5M10]PIB34453.1 hypothetical protein BFP72_02985 [Reichenbachiella sp. 5M10]
MSSEEVILWQCYLSKEGDMSNRLVCFAGALLVVYKGKHTRVDMPWIRSMQVQDKKLIIALVAGGIGTSLSMMALGLGWYHYQLNLFSVFFFFGLMYWGFVGQKALVLEEKNHQHLFLYYQVHPEVKDMIRFVYELLRTQQRKSGQLIYHLTTHEHWQQQTWEPNYRHPSLDDEGFIHASLREELSTSYQLYFDSSVAMVLLEIDPSQLNVPLEWEYVEARQASFPHIKGVLPKSSVLQALAFDGEEKLQALLS